ncbi:MAG: hypothetical protein RBS56_00705 [Candidatus Gracilibacteria bacterium]|jgi:uncharacterized protein YoxC|nr:hypothetical protein [Candidatus Gracilibacteria bacterium]
MSDLQNNPTKEQLIEYVQMFLDSDKTLIFESLEKSNFVLTPEVEALIDKAFDNLEKDIQDDIEESEKMGEDLQKMKEDLASYKENLKPIITEDLEVAKEKVSDFESFVDTTVENATKEQEDSEIEAVRASLAKKSE